MNVKEVEQSCHVHRFAHSRPLTYSNSCMSPYVLLIESELNEMNSCFSLLHSPINNVLFRERGGRGDCFLQLKMKFLNVFKRCCLSSNLYDRGLFLTFAYTHKKSSSFLFFYVDKVYAK